MSIVTLFTDTKLYMNIIPEQNTSVFTSCIRKFSGGVLFLWYQ